MTDAPAFRGTPPNLKQLAAQLGARHSLWDAVRELAIECGATWKWVYSEATSSWTYRSYLPGERFFASLSLKEDAFELSLNLKADEWDLDAPGTTESERTFLEELRAKALASGDEPAWVHVAVTHEGLLPAITKLLLFRGRRVQAPRTKKRHKDSRAPRG